MQLYITLNSKQFTILAEENDKIESIKNKIESIHNIPLYRQQLYLGYKKLENNKTLSYYKIINKTILDLYLDPPKGSYTIKIKTLTGRIIHLEVEAGNTLFDIKTKIKENEGIPEEEQRYIYNGKALEDSRTLYDYNITEGKIIHLILRINK